MTHVEEQFQWLLTMAKTPGFEAHARRRAKELQDSNPMYAGMWPRLAKEMGWKVEEAATPASSNSTPSSPR